MRRVLLALLSLALVFAVASPASAAGSAPIRGAASGTGHLSVSGGGCVAEETWNGTLRASVIGSATFTGGICARSLGTYLSGVTITARGGTLSGVSGPIASTGSVSYTVSGGTGRFARSAGLFTFVISTTSVFDCDPRVQLCFGRTFTAAISGTLRLSAAPA
jgi:hypothetical protein